MHRHGASWPLQRLHQVHASYSLQCNLCRTCRGPSRCLPLRKLAKMRRKMAEKTPTPLIRRHQPIQGGVSPRRLTEVPIDGDNGIQSPSMNTLKRWQGQSGQVDDGRSPQDHQWSVHFHTPDNVTTTPARSHPNQTAPHFPATAVTALSRRLPLRLGANAFWSCLALRPS